MQTQNTTSLSSFLYDEDLLWSQLKAGDKDALEKIYLSYSQELFRYGMAIKPNRSFIKDCIQELFVDLWKYRCGLKQTDNIKHYLFRSLSNRILKEVSHDKRFFMDYELCEIETVNLEESEEEKLIGRQVNESLQKKLSCALDGLPVRQRQVIQLLFFEKLTYEAVSGILGITVDSCYTLAWKAISRMKKSILIISYFFLLY
ncbi:sigma-70 family RNA polymerase sigma factor [Algoriphagus aestuariicola]|uniref:Sigma-70 family RNA polymerase sigma factor n=1 Tax=Algoriphagus aestuariicola TaxID=1852016 RepID=A0ABS3BSY4_9BACT|nr:sigma-70 family RNA polymerase sigma factor [Algoriphagus aestuariicola]MBN7801465.1 sigma-70 family RNA polymerase sigma factor [Algoriphagus aestuariicola]